MQIHEICQRCGLTRKAVDYYRRRELIAPKLLENGYWDYSEEDALRLKRVAVLRGLGLSVEETRAALDDPAALNGALRRRQTQCDFEAERLRLLNMLARNGDWTGARSALDALSQRRSILDRLAERFPGGLGQYLCAHFSAFLNEPIRTDAQREAFDEITAWLDSASLSEETLRMLDEAMDGVDIEGMAGHMHRAMQEPEAFWKENREIVEGYLSLQRTEEYRRSPAFRLKQALERELAQSGYTSRFLPAMCRLSPSYRAYREALQRADDKMRKEP